MNNVLYIQIDEDISSVLQRTEHFKKTTLYLVIPKKSILFQSSVNLGILKHRCEEAGNQLILVTSDRVGENLAKNVGLKVQPDLLTKGLKAKKVAGQEIRAHPIQARRNELVKEEPQRTEKKITLGELIRETRSQKKEDGKRHADLLAYLPRSRPKLLALMTLLSISLFFLITYIALPKILWHIQFLFCFMVSIIKIKLRFHH